MILNNLIFGKKKKLSDFLIFAYKNEIPWEFDKLDKVHNFERRKLSEQIPPIQFSLALLEFSKTSNAKKICFKSLKKNGYQRNDDKGTQNELFKNHLRLIKESLNYQNFYSQCMNFDIFEWYTFFKNYNHKDKEKNYHLYSDYYPPEHFWGYIGALVLLILNYINLNDEEKQSILLNWQNQIINLLDASYIDQGSLRFNYYEYEDVDKIKCHYNEMGSSWLIYIAPFLRPFERGTHINNLLNRFNKLGFYNHRLIEHIGYKVEVFHNKFCNIIRYGGFNLYNAECFGDYYSLKKEMSISMQIIEKYGWINDLVKMDDEFFIKTKDMFSPKDNILDEVSCNFRQKYKDIY